MDATGRIDWDKRGTAFRLFLIFISTFVIRCAAILLGDGTAVFFVSYLGMLGILALMVDWTTLTAGLTPAGMAWIMLLAVLTLCAAAGLAQLASGTIM